MIAPGRTVERWTYEATHWADLAHGKPRLLAALGLGLLGVLGGTVALILLAFGGAFSTYAVIHAELPAAGAAVALGSPVEYRDVTVGKVATSATGALGGPATVVLHLQRSLLKSVPAGVTATVAPISVFGNQYVVLVAPSSHSAQTLRDGQMIPALAQPTSTLQTTLTSLDSLLVQVHPAQLYAALSAVADALQGQGQSLGTTLVRFNTYLQNMLPLWPRTVADLQLLAPVARQLAASTPDVVDTLANLSLTGATINSAQSSVDQILAGGSAFANTATTLLININQPYAQLAAASGPFLQSLSQTPTTIAQTLQGLDGWAKTWVAAEAKGPYLTLTAAPIVVKNAADLALTALGGPDEARLLAGALGPGVVDPPTYSAADCPRYGSLTGRNCSGVNSTAAAVLTELGPVTILPEPAQQQAAATIAAGLDDGVPPSSPDVATLLLSPVLTHMVTSP